MQTLQSLQIELTKHYFKKAYGTMPKIFDNQPVRRGTQERNSLAMGVHNVFRKFRHLDIATGYINLSAWDEFAHEIAAKPYDGEEPVARILVGMVTRSTSEQMRQYQQRELRGECAKSKVLREQQPQIRDELVAHLREQLMSGASSSIRAQALRTLKEQLREGRVQIKVFTSEPLHGKTYIARQHLDVHDHVQAIGFVGSSNFTHAGLHTNRELNIDVLDSNGTEELQKWFNKLWKSRSSYLINDEIIDLIEQSWAVKQPSPYDVYLKVCYELSADMREGGEYTLPSSLENILLDYQKSAVKVLARRIMRRGGTMLGDVVGLGKTLTAVATASMLQNAENFRTLVLCPPNLVQMWEEHLDAYEVNGRVIPYSMAHKKLPETRRFGLVICDESHNLRHEGTLAHGAIRDYMRENDARVLLLTATPFNLSFKDVKAQLSLYIDDDDDLGIAPVEALKKNPKISELVDGKVTTLRAFELSEEVEDWRRLMSDHLVRRTRSYARRSAPVEMYKMPDGRIIERSYVLLSDGRKFYYPDRVSKAISHDFAADDPARLMESEQTLDDIKNLNLPRYNISAFDDPSHAHDENDLEIIENAKSGRGNVRGFVQAGLYKRLSSSGDAFIKSLKRQLRRNELWLYAIENKLPVPTGSYSEKQLGTTGDGDFDIFYGSDSARSDNQNVSNAAAYESLRQNAPAQLRWVNSTIFRNTLRQQLEHDNDILRSMLARFGSWTVQRDSKLKALKDLIENTHAGDKVLVFTEYKDTAHYVAQGLRELGVERVAAVSGDSENPTDLARRFSPESNRLPGEEQEHSLAPEDELNVLIATDVLSEGQNLQDSHVVVNYDLPWAIIRLIQRAGRVDRVGQTSDIVNVYLISHENVEETLNLRSRIKARLDSSALAFGSDEKFFDSELSNEAETRILQDFYAGRVEDPEEDDPFADAVSEAGLVWFDLLKKDPGKASEIANAQDKLMATRAVRAGDVNASFVNYVATASGVDLFTVLREDPATAEIKPALVSAAEALRLFYAEPSTPTAAPLDNGWDMQRQLTEFSFTQDAISNGNLKGTRKRLFQRFHDRTNTRSLLHNNTAAEQLLDRIFHYPLQRDAEISLRRAMRHLNNEELLAELKRMDDSGKLVLSSLAEDDVRVVCSLGIAPRGFEH